MGSCYDGIRIAAVQFFRGKDYAVLGKAPEHFLIPLVPALPELL